MDVATAVAAVAARCVWRCSVSEGQPLQTHILLPHTWQYKVIGRTVYARLCCGVQWQAHWLSYLLCWRHKQTEEQREERRKFQEEKQLQAQVAGAVVLEQGTALECDAAAAPRLSPADEAPLLLPHSSSDDTPPPVAAVAAPTEEAKGLPTIDEHCGGVKPAPLRSSIARFPSSAGSGLGPAPQRQEMELTTMPRSSVVGVTPPSPPMRAAAAHTRHFTHTSLHGAATLSPDDIAEGPTMYRTISIQQALGTDANEVQTIRRRANSSRRGSAQATSPSALGVEGSARRRSVSFAPGTKEAVESPPHAAVSAADAGAAAQAASSSEGDGDSKPAVSRASSHFVVQPTVPSPDGAPSSGPATGATQPAGESSPPPRRSSMSVKNGRASHSRHHSHSHSRAGGVPPTGAGADGEDVAAPAFHEPTEDATAADTDSAAADQERTLPVLVVPVQEGVAPAAQVLVTPPRHKLRFQLVEPLLERIFPRIRILGANAVDGFIYLKYLQLTILMVAIMTIIALPVLLTVHITSADRAQRSAAQHSTA